MVYARSSQDGPFAHESQIVIVIGVVSDLWANSAEAGTNLLCAIKSYLCIRQNVLLPDLMNQISSLQQFRRLITRTTQQQRSNCFRSLRSGVESPAASIMPYMNRRSSVWPAATHRGWSATRVNDDVPANLEASKQPRASDSRSTLHALHPTRSRPASRVILARSSGRLLGPLLPLAVSQLHRRPR
jgi:hypothetical protein